MKIKGYIACLLMQCFLVIGLFAQTNQMVFNNEYFKSVFSNIASGEFKGTANGVLFLKNPEKEGFILDFQGSIAQLVMETDPDTVYDVSTKVYTAYTTSSKTKLTYETYGLGNELNIEYRGEMFRVGLLDGASDMVIDGLLYYYKAEKEAEYLVLTVTKELKLSNYHFLLKKVNYDESRINDEVIKKERFITLQPHSTLIVAIKRQ